MQFVQLKQPVNRVRTQIQVWLHFSSKTSQRTLKSDSYTALYEYEYGQYKKEVETVVAGRNEHTFYSLSQ